MCAEEEEEEGQILEEEGRVDFDHHFDHSDHARPFDAQRRRRRRGRCSRKRGWPTAASSRSTSETTVRAASTPRINVSLDMFSCGQKIQTRLFVSDAVARAGF